MEPIAGKDFNDPVLMESLYVKRKGGAKWGGLEAEFGLVNAHGMTAFRAFWKHVVQTGKPDTLPQSLRDDKEFKELLKSKPEPKPEEPKPEPEVIKVEVKAGRHKMFAPLLRVCKARVNAMLVGPAGSGKTSAATQVAQELGLPFYAISVGGQTTQAQIIGYMDAGGTYRPTVFRAAYEKGGVFLLDEVDAGNANVLTVLNAALANGEYAFPDGMVKRSADFVCIAAANTWGQGADRQYVGRNQLDAATLDRFMAKVFWNYDEEQESAWSGNAEWTRRVQQIRNAVSGLKLRVMVTPRASIEGAKLLNAGFSRREVEDFTIFNATDGETKKKVLACA